MTLLLDCLAIDSVILACSILLGAVTRLIIAIKADFKNGKVVNGNHESFNSE